MEELGLQKLTLSVNPGNPAFQETRRVINNFNVAQSMGGAMV
jgi:hypothetical protein